VFRAGGVMRTCITVQSEPEGGRLFFQLLMKGRSFELAKQRSMTLERCVCVLLWRVTDPGSLCREYLQFRAVRKYEFRRASSLAEKVLFGSLIELWMLKSPSTRDGSWDFVNAMVGGTERV
jgi:hypothetical protein